MIATFLNNMMGFRLKKWAAPQAAVLARNIGTKRSFATAKSLTGAPNQARFIGEE
jgi:hypothetical protein